MVLVEVAAASLTVVSELDFELHLILRHRQLTHRARCIDSWTAPYAVRGSRWQLAGAHGGAGVLAEGRFIGHRVIPEAQRVADVTQ